MLEREFQPLDALADSVNSYAERWLSENEALRETLRAAVEDLPKSHSVQIVVEVRVFDSKREQAMRLLSVGLSASAGHAPYDASSDCSPHRYLVDGEICQVPHDHCPHCWANWDFKLKHPVCPSCGYTMGRQVKLLLDSDACPHCEVGKVCLRDPVCTRCGFEVDLEVVAWG